MPPTPRTTAQLDNPLEHARALLSRVAHRDVRQRLQRALVLWDLEYVREALSQFRLVAEQALRRALAQLTDQTSRVELEQQLAQGQVTRVLRSLHRDHGHLPARVALHLHTLLAWGNYASHHQRTGHDASAGDLTLLIAVAIDLEQWLSRELEQRGSIFEPEDLQRTQELAEQQVRRVGLDAEVARVFVAHAGGRVRLEPGQLSAPALGLELYLEPQPQRPSAGNPFRGLEAFNPEDAGRFFGRDQLSAELEQAVDTHRLTLVCGASGSGKTSLLRAALLPRLLQLGCGVLYVSDFGEAALSTIEAMFAAWPRWPALVVVLDQLERTLLPDLPPALRGAFLRLVLQAGQQQQGRRLVLGLREDFLGALLREVNALAPGQGGNATPPLLGREDAVLTVGPLDAKAASAAVQRPLEGSGISLDPRLLQHTLLPELADGSGTRPTELQIVCRVLYQQARKRKRSTIDRDLYDELGGARSILGRHLDQALSDSCFDGQRDLARALLKAMTGLETRRWVDLGSLWQAVAAGGATADELQLRQVLGRLIDQRLVISTSDGADEPPRYSLMHDRLLDVVQRWTTREEIERQQAQQTLVRALENWRDPARREPLTGRSLELVEQHFTRLPLGQDAGAAHQLLRASRRGRRTRRALIAALIALATLGIGFGMFQLRRAVHQRDRAVLSADQGVLLRARLALDTDPSIAVALLRNLTLERSNIGVQTLLEEARRRGVAAVLAGHRHLVTAVAFSRDGRLLASASRDRTIRLWDPVRRRPLTAPLRGHQDFVSSVAFSPDGMQLISASWDGTLRVWDPAAGSLRATVRCGAAWLHALSVAPDGGSAVVGDAAGQLHRVDLRTRKRTRSFQATPGHALLALAHSPDGRLLAGASQDHTVRLWRADTLEPVGQVLTRHPQGAFALAFSPDGALLASGDRSGQLRLCQLADRCRTVRTVAAAHDGGVLALAFSPRGDSLASAGADKLIRLWAPDSAEPRGPPLRGHLGLVNDISFSADGALLASGSSDHTVRLWQLSHRRAHGLHLRGHRLAVQAVAFSPDGAELATAGRDGRIRLWDSTRRVQWQRPLRSEPALAVAYSPDGRWLAAGGDQGTVRLWARGAGRAPWVGRTGARQVQALAFSPDSRWLATACSDGRIHLWSAPAGKHRVLPALHSDAVFALAFAPDGSRLYSAGRDTQVVAWDLTRGQPAYEPLQGPQQGVYALACSPDGHLLAVGGGDASIRLWDTRQRRPVGPPLRGHRHWVLSLAFAPDGRTLASGSSDATVRLWARGSRWAALGPPLTGHTDWVNSVAFSPDGTVLASGSADHTVWLWQNPGPTPTRTLHRIIDRLTNLRVLPDGRAAPR